MWVMDVMVVRESVRVVVVVVVVVVDEAVDVVLSNEIRESEG